MILQPIEVQIARKLFGDEESITDNQYEIVSSIAELWNLSPSLARVLENSLNVEFTKKESSEETEVVKSFGRDFYSPGGALTLPPLTGLQSSGWTIEGEVITDYYEWINEFKASHPDQGEVWGNFEREVHASSEKAYQHFYASHPPTAWDYWEI